MSNNTNLLLVCAFAIAITLANVHLVKACARSSPKISHVQEGEVTMVKMEATDETNEATSETIRTPRQRTTTSASDIPIARIRLDDEKAEAKFSIPSDCLWEPRTGRCRAYIPRYFYDKETGECKRFIFGVSFNLTFQFFFNYKKNNSFRVAMKMPTISEQSTNVRKNALVATKLNSIAMSTKNLIGISMNWICNLIKSIIVNFLTKKRQKKKNNFIAVYGIP